MPPETPIRDIVDRCRPWERHVDSDVRRISKPGPDGALPTYVVSDSGGRMVDRMVAAVATSQSTPNQLETAACWSSRADTTSEAGAPYCGTVVTVLVSGGSGSKAYPGRGDWEF